MNPSLQKSGAWTGQFGTRRLLPEKPESVALLVSGGGFIERDGEGNVRFDSRQAKTPERAGHAVAW